MPLADTQWISQMYEPALGIMALLLILMTIIGIVKLWPRRGETFMRKRHPLIFYGLAIAIVALLVERMMLLVVVRHFGPVALLLLPLFILEMSRWTIVCLVLTRTWMLWFTIKWTHFAMDDGWEFLLNSSKGDGRRRCINWFLSTRSKWGNFSVMIRYFGSFSFLCFLVCCAEWVRIVIADLNNEDLVDQFGMKKSNSVFLCTFIPCFLMEIYLLWATPKFVDEIWLQWEYKVQTRLVLLLALAIIVRNVCTIMIDQASIIRAVTLPINMLLCFAPIFVQLFVVPAIIPPNPSECGLIRTNSASPTETNGRSPQLRHQRTKTFESEMTFQQIMSDPTALNLFMVFLSKLYDMETLLSFIEFNQYQQYLMDMHLSVVTDAAKDRISEMNFPENIPLSEIMESRETGAEIHSHGQGVTELDMAKIKAWKLYEKYVAPNSEFEIKITSSERDKLTARLGNIRELLDDKKCNEGDLLIIFENCKNAMKVSLIHAMKRFKQTFEYKQAITAMSGNQELIEVQVEKAVVIEANTNTTMQVKVELIDVAVGNNDANTSNGDAGDQKLSPCN